MARKIEYKNLIQEIETAHTHVPWRAFRAFFSLFKNVSVLCFGQSLCQLRLPWAGLVRLLLGAPCRTFFFFSFFSFLKKGS